MNYNYSQKWLAALAAGAMLGLMPARAVDFHVSTAQELQNALTLAAANGADNNIYLTNGYYIGNFNFNSTGGYSLMIANEPSVTNNSTITIDGAGLGRDMNLANTGSGNVTVRGMTFLRNCGNSSIGALRIAPGSSATILVRNCQFLSPSNTSGMGLELASGLNATITNCSVIGAAGGGGGLGMSVSGVTGDVAVQNCFCATNGGGNTGNGLVISGAGLANISGNSFIGNIATGSGPDGGGLSCSGINGAIIVSNNMFIGNQANGTWSPSYGSGGGAYCSLSSGAITLSGNTFAGNSSGQYGNGGGAFCHLGSGLITVFANTFAGNSHGGGGGGIYCNGIATFSNNSFSSNSAGSGGGVSCGAATFNHNNFSGNSAGNGGGVYCSNSSFTNNTFTGNSASQSGGGLYCSGAVNCYGNIFTRNSAATGGGLYGSGSLMMLQGNLVVNNQNTSASSQGGGIWVNATSNLFMINNTIFGNTAAGSGGGAAFQVNGTVELLNVYNNIIWGNSASGNGADVWLAGTGQQKVFLYNDVNDMYGVWDIAQNLLNVDPKFFDPVNGDYHLQSTSPCLNAGTNGAPSLPLTDLDGNLRTNTLGQVDLGCYEFNTTATLPADTNADFVISPAEYNAYAAAWKNGQTWTNAPNSAPNPNPIPANYVTRAGYLMTNSAGAYHNDGSARPTNWKPGP